jgi:hypothetical protein
MFALSHRQHRILFALTVCLNATPACAGFINFIVGDDLTFMAAPELGMTQRPTEEPPRQDGGAPLQLLDAAITALPWDATSSSMGSSGSGSSSVVPAFALVDTHSCSTGQIETYLIARPGVELPVPFLSGVFRPPRCFL